MTKFGWKQLLFERSTKFFTSEGTKALHQRKYLTRKLLPLFEISHSKFMFLFLSRTESSTSTRPSDCLSPPSPPLRSSTTTSPVVTPAPAATAAAPSHPAQGSASLSSQPENETGVEAHTAAIPGPIKASHVYLVLQVKHYQKCPYLA